MIIKIIKNLKHCWNYEATDYVAGDQKDLPDALANRLIELDCAVAINDVVNTKNDAPINKSIESAPLNKNASSEEVKAETEVKVEDKKKSKNKGK